MRARLVGSLVALLAIASAWKHFSEGWLVLALGLVALALASIYCVVRPSKRALGIVQLLWGGLMIYYVVGKGVTLRFDNARTAGGSIGVILGGVFALALIVWGVRNLR